MQRIKIIVAITENNAIGKNGKLLFHFKEDLKNFKKLTSGNILIMGRKTYESIGKPLSNRINIVLSKSETKDSDVIIKQSLEEAIEYARDFSKDCDIYIIGGEKVYNEAIEKDIVDEIILTRIKSTVIDADAFFPNLNYDTKWKINRIQSFSEGFGKEYDICYIDRR